MYCEIYNATNIIDRLMESVSDQHEAVCTLSLCDMYCNHIPSKMQLHESYVILPTQKQFSAANSKQCHVPCRSEAADYIKTEFSRQVGTSSGSTCFNWHMTLRLTTTSELIDISLSTNGRYMVAWWCAIYY